jgi:hypothetical protein
LLVLSMPRRKTAGADDPISSESTPKKRASAAKPKASAATHKRASKSVVSESPITAEELVGASVSSSSSAEIAAPVENTFFKDQPGFEDQPRPQITLETIARRAYSYWEARGYQGEQHEEDWFRAERELLLEFSKNR